MMSPPLPLERVVVVGASAGGLEAIGALLADMPADLPAALLFVMHIGAASFLAHILARRSAWPVLQAANGQSIEAGRVYVAVPDLHLLVHDSHLLLRRGPRENQARPAVDPLFRTAAASFGSRAIGVVLSGGLSDGAAGLRAIKRCGGVAVVQEPQEAAVSDMPVNALRYVDVDHVCPAGEIGGLLAKLVQQPPGPTPEIPLDIRVEAAIAVQGPSDMTKTEQLGGLPPFTCPECHGVLWQIRDGPLVRYRCHVGHAFTAQAVLDGESEEIQRRLEGLLRSNRERAALVRRMAENERREQRHKLAAQLERRAGEYEESVRLVREMLEATTAQAVTKSGPRGKVPANGEEEESQA